MNVWEAKEVLFASYDLFCLNAIHEDMNHRNGENVQL